MARFNASGTPTVMPPVVTRDSEWDQPAEPEWDLYPHDITEVPSAAWPVDERDPFQNPAIARGLYRSFSP